ncbi:MAG: cobalamin biosynthesis protein CobD [Lachnospiraceae bacterium]|nr:cobalamin biosynthesis protein CobD [Lachnospiraceae bacterium]
MQRFAEQDFAEDWQAALAGQDRATGVEGNAEPEAEPEEIVYDESFWDQTPVKKATNADEAQANAFDAGQANAGYANAYKAEQASASETQKAEPLSEEAKKKREQGRTMVLIVLFCTVLVTDIVFMGSYFIHPILGCIVEAILTYQILAAKCLYMESMKVYKALKTGTIADARRAVSMIVGRDTAKLDEEGVTKAAVETVAENTSDGVIAPMLYLAIGGPILGMLYKAINTMDSMVGYKNDRYLDFGRAAAKLDDYVNYLPSRIAARLMIFSCHFLGGGFIASEAKRIYFRDRLKHSSPNSAQTESACAGALGIQLAGDASYFGKVVHKPTIGDARRKVDPEDIARANKLMYGTTILCFVLCLAVLAAVTCAFFGGVDVIKLWLLSMKKV